MLQSPNLSHPMVCQAVFRVLLSALSSPGEVRQMPAACSSSFLGIMEGVCRTLIDHEVRFCLCGSAIPALSEEMIVQWTHSGSTPPEEADFLFVTGPGGHEAIKKLRRGTPETPDHGGTAIFLSSHSLSTQKKSDAAYTIAGPGIPPSENRRMPALFLPPEDMEAIREANAEFPMGIDCFFLDARGGVVGLPRSVSIHKEAQWHT